MVNKDPYKSDWDDVFASKKESINVSNWGDKEYESLYEVLLNYNDIECEHDCFTPEFGDSITFKHPDDGWVTGLISKIEDDTFTVLYIKKVNNDVRLYSVDICRDINQEIPY